MKIVYVVGIQDEFVRNYIDLIRYMANPQEKRTAHITVRGPYTRHYNMVKQNRIVNGAEIIINGIGTFFQGNQNTVFLECESDILKKVWKKTTYNEYNPHITLYDGYSRSEAEELYHKLVKYNYNIKFKATELIPIVTISKHLNFDLKLELNTDLLCKFTKLTIPIKIIESSSFTYRLTLIEQLLNYLPSINVT